MPFGDTFMTSTKSTHLLTKRQMYIYANSLFPVALIKGLFYGLFVSFPGKFIEIRVTGAASAKAARTIGKSIANSPLVKTAIAGEDANWGRIVMAVGKSGEKADRDRLSIAMGGVEITRDGQLVAGYDEAPVARHMKGSDIAIAVDLGVGRGRATVWTCDLTHGYIDINADYRS